MVRLGASSYYEPLTLTIGGRPYTNRTSMRAYTVLNPDVEKLEMPLTIVFHRGGQLSNTQSDMAALIYDNVKDCLISRENIEAYLDALCEKPLESGGSVYRFLYDVKLAQGQKYYFVTAQNVVVTGFEAAYINRYFAASYLVLGAILIVTAMVLARFLSTPLKELNKITEKLKDLDFSKRAHYKSPDEMGQLTDQWRTGWNRRWPNCGRQVTLPCKTKTA